MDTNEKISLEKLKSALSIFSTGLLAIQHFVGVFAPNIKVAYIPLCVTYFTIFINSLGDKNSKALRIMSMISFSIILIVGITIYYIGDYGIKVQNINFMINRGMYVIIGISSLVLAILYIEKLTRSE